MANLPIATIVAGETMEIDNDYKDICEKVKCIRDQVSEFYETETEFNEAIGPIEQDPQSFTSGKPILKKYAHALLEKMEHERQLEAEEEAKRDKHLTPQQVKADLKHYVSTCEKKIAQQQEQCDALQKQVERLCEVIKCIVTWSEESSRDHISLLSHCSMLDIGSMDYFTSKLKIEKKTGNISSSLHYSVFANKIENVKIILNYGADINFKSYLMKDSSHILEGRLFTALEIASNNASLEMVKLLIEKGATIGDTTYKVPNGPEGDLVAGYLQTHGSKPVTRF